MNFFVYFVFVINIVFVYIYVVLAQDIGNSCWNGSMQCNIAGTFTRKGFSKPFVVDIDCDDSVNDSSSTSGVRRFMRVHTIILNGCNNTRNNSIGVEYVEDPESVTNLTITLFKVNTFHSEHLHKFKFVNNLRLSNNVFEEIIDPSFQDVTLVETLTILNNNLNVIAPHALTALINLNNLTIIEMDLSIESLNYTFCDTLKHIRLAVRTYDWQMLPQSLQTLDIFSTKITFSLKTFGIKDCENFTWASITTSELLDVPQLESRSLKFLNLSKNSLNHFPSNYLPSLEVLDISNNQMRNIDTNILKSMVKLMEFDASNNRIEKISKTAFVSNTHLETINISGNLLKSIQFIEYLLIQISLKIFIDENPWSCMWVLNVSSEHPEIFATFHYNKFSNKNKVNVNGLNCLFYDVNGYNVYENSIATESIPISSTLPFAENIEISYRRNPKDTALITLVILVVGVAVLFFLLYLHIKCRQNTIEPFYRSLPYDTHQMSDRIDIIRRNLPSTDYEAPITTNTDAEVIYEQIPEKYTNYERIPEKFTVQDGFDDVNSVLSYKIAIKNSES